MERDRKQKEVLGHVTRSKEPQLKRQGKVVEGATEKVVVRKIKSTLPKNKGGIIMPGFDRTGPMGAGPMTGRAAGRCNPQQRTAMPNNTGFGYGRGLGFRCGFRGGGRRGMGWGGGYFSNAYWYSPESAPVYAMEPADELEYLKRQSAHMTSVLEAINRRIEVFNKDNPSPETE
jgi:hypothetical protein